jgi:concentrative nucleoside transporter, CNT family
MGCAASTRTPDAWGAERRCETPSFRFRVRRIAAREPRNAAKAGRTLARATGQPARPARFTQFRYSAIDGEQLNSFSGSVWRKVLRQQCRQQRLAAKRRLPIERPLARRPRRSERALPDESTGLERWFGGCPPILARGASDSMVARRTKLAFHSRAAIHGLRAMEKLVSLLGILVFMGLAWLMSSHKRVIQWRAIVGGLALQFGFAFLTLGTKTGREVFGKLGEVFTALLGFVEEGSVFVFGTPSADSGTDRLLLTSFAFGVLPSIVFFSSLVSILYHFGIMQRIVRLTALAMQKTLKLSGAESLSVAANIFLGQVESPLVVRPYLNMMTRSELMAVMMAGFATVAGGVLAAYVQMGIDAGHLVAASVIAAPASIVIAKIMQPEVDQPRTSGQAVVEVETGTINAIEAAATGALDGLTLAIQVAGIIIAFLALIALVKFAVAAALGLFGYHWTLEDLLGTIFAPFAWLMGIERADCRAAGELLGLRMISNEFIAFKGLAEMMQAGGQISPRTQVLLTYALCGFANFGSIGVQLGGIGAVAPERRTDLARLGLRAMLGGTLACFMTACVAGVLL